MTRRRRILAVLMRARMLAARETTVDSTTSSSAAAKSPLPVLTKGHRRDDAEALMRASISSSSISPLADISYRNLRDFVEVCLEMPGETRQKLLHTLAEDYDVDRSRVRYLMQQYLSLDDPCSGEQVDRLRLDGQEESPTLSVFYRIERNLSKALKPKYANFIEQLIAQPGGLKLLVDLRADLLLLLKEHNIASLRALDFFLKEKLVTCLSPATLELQQITWNDSASLLEKIVAYEAVHPIRNLLDLKRRLSAGRRCFGYLHPAIPGEPLIFIEVALLKNIAQSIQEVLWESPPIPETEAKCALFYSISSTQLGLSGINLGRFLIKRVVELLRREMSHASIFATLSPIPGYMQWLQSKLVCYSKLSECGCESHSEDRSNSTFVENILTADEEGQIIKSCPVHISGKNAMEVMQKMLASPTYEWAKNDQLLAALSSPLMRLCARYLLKEKKRGRALDAVANFHLQNGAMIERINWMADRSEKGLQESGGIMVNYVYRLDEIEENAQAYSATGEIRVSRNFAC